MDANNWEFTEEAENEAADEIGGILKQANPKFAGKNNKAIFRALQRSVSEELESQLTEYQLMSTPTMGRLKAWWWSGKIKRQGDLNAELLRVEQLILQRVQTRMAMQLGVTPATLERIVNLYAESSIRVFEARQMAEVQKDLGSHATDQQIRIIEAQTAAQERIIKAQTDAEIEKYRQMKIVDLLAQYNLLHLSHEEALQKLERAVKFKNPDLYYLHEERQKQLDALIDEIQIMKGNKEDKLKIKAREQQMLKLLQEMGFDGLFQSSGRSKRGGSNKNDDGQGGLR